MNQEERLNKFTEELLELAADIRRKNALLLELQTQDHVAKAQRLEAELAEVRTELEAARESAVMSNAKIEGLMGIIQRTKEALGDPHTRSLEERAHQVYTVLRSIVPHHPLMRDAEDEDPYTLLGRSDVQFIYACLKFAAEKMGRMGCNDWIVYDPNETTLAFMQRVEDYTAAADPGYERQDLRVKGGRVFGPGNLLVPYYLCHVLERIYGKETFKDHDKLGL